ncbi:MAG: Flippase-like protein [Candidatus Poribacteria bacterium]|nr:Flippase-like protein [Candidatus Poribacteria bacterium]
MFPQAKLIHKIIKLLPILGIFLYAYIIWRTGIGNIIKAFNGIKVIYIIITPFFLFVVVLLKGLKWKLILSEYGQKFSYKDACMTWCIGAFAGGFTPGQAGEAIKALYVKKANPDKSFGECLSTIFSDKIIEIYSLMALAIVSAVLLFNRLSKNPLYIPVIVFACLVLIVFYALTEHKVYILFGRLFRPIINFIVPHRYRDSLKISLEGFLSGIWELKNKKRILLFLWLIAVFTWFVLFLNLYLLALSLSLDISLLYTILISPIINFASILPISISGLGTRDLTTIFFFNEIGLGKESAVAWSMLSLATSWILSLVGWIISLKPSLWLKLNINEMDKPPEI